ncbi:type II secretion system protein GspK [Litoreibacter roseus]|uniref:General secretion pathway protein K n=1 Tax=Litoreibacter roseus TaxID=2601869 RepID=A0A6N6JKD1_9RHOB|nr:type II secretion system protein GspK [Litoreibacter roseus]GFE66495.1 hypothetical protein KIN_35690 [Litoreibacter roseus]
MPRPLKIRRRLHRGFILLTVLWMALGLLLAASSFLASHRQEALAIRAEVELGRAVALARSAVNVALADLGRVDENSYKSPRDGTPVTINMAEGSATYRIWDEGGKLDINAAPVQLLLPALRMVGEGGGLDAFDAASIAQAIIARRSGDRGPIEAASVSTVLARLGVPEAQSRNAREVLTTFNGDAQINPRTAPEQLLAVIPGVGPSDVSEILIRRREGRGMPRLGSAASWLNGVEGPVYTINAMARLTGGATADMTVTVAARGIGFRGGRMEYDILDVQILR